MENKLIESLDIQSLYTKNGYIKKYILLQKIYLKE